MSDVQIVAPRFSDLPKVMSSFAALRTDCFLTWRKENTEMYPLRWVNVLRDLFLPLQLSLENIFYLFSCGDLVLLMSIVLGSFIVGIQNIVCLFIFSLQLLVH